MSDTVGHNLKCKRRYDGLTYHEIMFHRFIHIIELSIYIGLMSGIYKKDTEMTKSEHDIFSDACVC